MKTLTVRVLLIAWGLVGCASRPAVEEAHEAQLAQERRGRERRAAPRARELARDAAAASDAGVADAADTLKQIEALGVDLSVPYGYGGDGTEAQGDAGE